MSLAAVTGSPRARRPRHHSSRASGGVAVPAAPAGDPAHGGTLHAIGPVADLHCDTALELDAA